MDINSKHADLSERYLRNYLATRQDISSQHKEKIVEHYMLVFQPGYTDEKAQQHIEKLAKGDSQLKPVATEALASFYHWLTTGQSETKGKLNFLTNLFRKK